MMTIKGFDYLLTETDDVHEQFHESLRDESGRPNYLVFCDAVSTADHAGPSRASQAAATLAEQSLTQYLDQHVNEGLDETALQRAFAHANERLLELYGDDRGAIAVSGVVMVLEPSQEAGQPDSFLVAGLGDIRVYRIDRDHADLVFFDPQTPEISGMLGAEERSLALHNAMGLDEHLRLTTRRVMQNPFQRYVLATYGAYSQVSEAELHQVGLLPHDPMQGATAQLKTLSLTAHTVRLCTATYEQTPGAAAELERTQQSSAPPETTAQTADASTPSGNNFNLVLGGAAAALALGIGMMWLGGSETDPVADATALTPTASEMEPTTTPATLAVDGELVQTIEGLKQQNTVLSQQLGQAREEIRDLLRSRGGRDDDALDQARQQRLVLEQQLQQAREKVAELSARRSTTADPAVRDEIAQLEKSLARSMEERNRMGVELQRTKQQLAERNELINATRGPQSAVAERYQAMETQLTQRVDQLMKENGTLREQLREQRDALTAELVTAREALTATTTPLDANGDARGEVDLAQTQAAAERIHELSTAMTEMERDRKHLEEALKQYRGQVNQLEQIVAAQKAELATRDPQTLSKLQSAMTQLTQDHDRALTTINKLQQRLSRQGQREATQQRQAEMTALTMQLKELSELNDAKTAEANELRELLTAAREAEQVMQPRLDMLMQQLTESQLATNEAEMKLREQTGYVEELKGAYEQAMTRVRRAGQSMEQVASLQGENRELQTERLKLLQDKAALMEKIAALSELDELYQAERELRVQRDKELNTLRQQVTRSVAAATANSAVQVPTDGNLTLADGVEALATLGEARPRLHVVQRGDTLSAISLAYYGTANHAEDIFQANREQLPSKNQIRVGTELIIP